MIDLDQAEHRFIDTGSARIHVATVGSGPPLLLLHGWPQDHRAWRHVVPELASEHTLILPDLRGFGQSEAPAGDYRKHALADDLSAVLDHLDHDRMGLVGHDWGGWVGFILALRHPERFRGYVALNISHPWAKIPLNPLRLLPFFYMPLVGTPGIGPLILRRTNAVRGIINAATVSRANPEAARFADMIGEPDRAVASSALYRHFLLRDIPALGRDFGGKKLQIPVRFVHGLKDPAIHRSMVEGLESKAPSVDYVWLDDAGHFPAEEQPKATADAIRSFFATHSP